VLVDCGSAVGVGDGSAVAETVAVGAGEVLKIGEGVGGTVGRGEGLLEAVGLADGRGGTLSIGLVVGVGTEAEVSGVALQAVLVTLSGCRQLF
jgi:hypothetical protein